MIVREYVTGGGVSLYRAWLSTLDRPVRARIQARVFRFELGNLGGTLISRSAVGRLIWRTCAMARRSKDWNEGLARDLRDPTFAREFLMASLDEGIPVQTALGKVIRAMGVKEFAAKIGMASPNLLRAISARHTPTHATINRLLKPFGLKLGLALLDDRPGKRAA